MKIEKVNVSEDDFGFYAEYDLNSLRVQIKRSYPNKETSWEYGVKTPSGWVEADRSLAQQISASEREAVKIWRQQ